jgi:hypothetical protein
MKSHASMNRIYRLVWNASLSLWVAVAENAKGASKGGSARSSVQWDAMQAEGGGGKLHAEHRVPGGAGGAHVAGQCSLHRSTRGRCGECFSVSAGAAGIATR